MTLTDSLYLASWTALLLCVHLFHEYCPVRTKAVDCRTFAGHRSLVLSICGMDLFFFQSRVRGENNCSIHVVAPFKAVADTHGTSIVALLPRYKLVAR